MSFLHFCYLEALYGHTLSSGEQGAPRNIDFVEDFSILKCGFAPIRSNCQKTNQQGDSLQRNSYPKAVILEVSLTAWTGKLCSPWTNLLEELPCFTDWAVNISHHVSAKKLGRWPCRWAGGQLGSPGIIPATSHCWVSLTWMQFRVYTTQVSRNNTSAGIMTGAAYNHLRVLFADLFIWWINVKCL